MAANSNLIALRESRKADLVILLTNHQFSDNDLGFVAAIGPSTSNAYGIVQLKYASSPYYVFVHEIGHLLGCHHHHAHPRDWSDCPYAWEIVPNWFYTVMEPHAPELKNGYHKHRLLNFSDPLIKFAGYKTGSDGSNNEFPSNNAGRIRETGCEVANFFGGSDLVVVINGDNSLCDDPEVYTANVTPPPLGQPGQPPYIYEWRWNLDGIFTPQNPGTLLNETSYQISVPDPDLGDCSFFFLHVKVSSNGVTGHATKRIATSCEPCPYPYFDSRSNKSISKKEHYDNNLLVFPNPLTSNITLNWSSNTEELINFELYSSEGKFLKSYNYFSHLGFNLFDINLNENFSNGYYLIRMMTSLSSTNYKIIISK